MAIRRYYPIVTSPVTVPAATTVILNFQCTYPNSTRSLKATPHLYPYTGFDNDFPQVPIIGTFQPNNPDTTKSNKGTPQSYPYFFADLFPQVPNVGSFTPSNPNKTSSNKGTPPLYPYMFRGDFPIVPNVGEFGQSSQTPIVQRGRLVNYNGQMIAQAIVAGRVHNLPLLGMG